MKLIILLGILFTSATVLGQSKTTTSPPVAKDECAVACKVSAKEPMKFTVIKKKKLLESGGNLPVGKDKLSCSDSLKKELQLTCDTCEVYCNPN